MDKLKNELYECIEKYGSTHEITIAKSQELDRYMNKNGGVLKKEGVM
ncbi:aspartyl-phosphate phosphatase Spo0E family protein [Clostridium sp. YIM B02551]|nr:aspartyl-phosphate phosphatase Spo0E family protein [Clostridium sp. YIM B02551]